MLSTIVKSLIFANLAVSVGLLSWSLSNHYTRSHLAEKDPSANKKSEDAAADDTNNLERLQWKVETLSESIKAAQTGYARAALTVSDNELLRDARADRFAVKLGEARNGTFKTFVNLPKSARIDVNAPGEPILGVDKKPVRGIDTVQQDLAKAIRDSEQSLTQSKQRRADYKTASDEIDVLFAKVAKQKDLFVQLKDEFDYLADRRTDWDEQVRTLKKRTDQVQAALVRLTGK